MCYFTFCKLLTMKTKKENKIKWDKIATLIYFLHPLVIKIIGYVIKELKIQVCKTPITYILVVFVTLICSILVLKLKETMKSKKKDLIK